MKKLLLLISVLLYARENPFVLPQETSVASASSVASIERTSSSWSSSSSSTSSSISAKQEIRLGFLRLTFFDDAFIVQTKDPLKKVFMIDTPHKIVLDFDKRRIFRTRKVLLDTRSFEKVEMGAHKDFYRIAVTLKRKCAYKVTRQSDRIVISCNE